MQLDTQHTELGASLPVKMQLPGGSRAITTHKVLAATGRRFVSAWSAAAPHPAAAAALAPEPDGAPPQKMLRISFCALKAAGAAPADGPGCSNRRT